MGVPTFSDSTLQNLGPGRISPGKVKLLSFTRDAETLVTSSENSVTLHSVRENISERTLQNPFNSPLDFLTTLHNGSRCYKYFTIH